MKRADAMECVYHNDRYTFDALVCDLRKARLVTRAHAKVMAMTVCTCKRKVSYRQPISEEQAHEAADYIISSSLPLFDNLSHPSHNLLMSSARLAQSLPISSQGRLCVLIHQALQNDVKLLEEEKAAALRSRGEEYLKALQKPKRNKITKDIIKKIVSKKKRKYPVKAEFFLPVFGGLSSQVLANPEVGFSFEKLRAKFCCVLELDSEATAKNMAANKPETVVNAWFLSKEAKQDAMQILIKAAKEVQRESTQHWQQRRQERGECRRMMRHAFNCHPDHNPQGTSQTPFFKPQEYKVHLSQDFEKKVLKKQRNDGKTSKRPVHREDGSSIAEGHCLHCLLSYKDYKAGNKTDVIKQCRHHPGYVTDGKWTCCNQNSDSQHPVHEEHAQNGCTTSRHSFRPHKKAVRGVGAKEYRYQRHYRENRVSLAAHTYTSIY